MIVSKENIESLIPQRPPFVMIDNLTASGEKSTSTSLQVRPDNIFVEDGKFREPGLLENIAQTAAARVGWISQSLNQPVPVGYIGAVKNFEILNLPSVDDMLETEITIANEIFDVTVVNGTIKCKGLVVAKCEMKIFITKT
ncbi:MAG: 3-hydroxyacyl-ACP dehydratase [Gemmatimonadaceae bacterium]|nr:3-hydroxyacyl-ACP dehydratase [Chitinophagaceae bacterium]